MIKSDTEVVQFVEAHRMELLVGKLKMQEELFENQKITIKKNKKNPLVLILLAALLVN